MLVHLHQFVVVDRHVPTEHACHAVCVGDDWVARGEIVAHQLIWVQIGHLLVGRRMRRLSGGARCARRRCDLGCRRHNRLQSGRNRLLSTAFFALVIVVILVIVIAVSFAIALVLFVHIVRWHRHLPAAHTQVIDDRHTVAAARHNNLRRRLDHMRAQKVCVFVQHHGWYRTGACDGGHPVRHRWCRRSSGCAEAARRIAAQLHFASMLRHADLNGGHLLGLVALCVVRIADALVVVEVGHTCGKGAARSIDAGVRTIVDIRAAECFGNDGNCVIVYYDLVWGNGKVGNLYYYYYGSDF